ncbi:helix-turn-helix domain-containing protein [Streptomyces carpaticus]|uniref:PucR family transcriptional regulator n=1 Tax=Streptomyces carpaticus TaxID=285558 RepID=UPI00220BDCFB|nr:helix-turn-helix domain-containing protein [Streptomyces carpaticus]
MEPDYQELIDEVSAQLGTPATLEGRDFALIAFGAHDSADDRVMDPVRTRSILHRRSSAEVRAWFERFGIARARGPVRIPPDPAAGVRTGRICLPARHHGVVYGYIWLVDDGALELTDPRLSDAQATAERIGALLARSAGLGGRLGALLHTLLTSPQREAAAGELAQALGPAGGGTLTLVVALPWDEGAPGLPGALAVCPLEGSLAALVRPPAARAVAERLSGPAVAAGIGTPRGATAELPDAWREALGAARAARAEPALGPVAHWSAIGAYRLLTALPPAAPDPVAGALLDPAHRELARTAETYLDQAGSPARTATALGIHRQTLYYRLTRVEHLTGLDLADGTHRLLLHLALKAARLHAATDHDGAGGEG